MSSKKKVFQKINPKNPTAAPTYYLESTSKDIVGISDLVQQVADISGVSLDDTHEIMDSFSKIVKEKMDEGGYDVLDFNIDGGLPKKLLGITLSKFKKPD